MIDQHVEDMRRLATALAAAGVTSLIAAVLATLLSGEASVVYAAESFLGSFLVLQGVIGTCGAVGLTVRALRARLRRGS